MQALHDDENRIKYEEWHDATQGLNESSLGDWFVLEAG